RTHARRRPQIRIREGRAAPRSRQGAPCRGLIYWPPTGDQMRFHFAAAFLAAFTACAQERVVITPRARPDSTPVLAARASLRMDVRMVQIPVTVTDLRGAPVLNLAQANFRVFDDNVERPIVALSVSDAPISAGIVFDSSRSMKPRLEDSRTAV